MKTKLPKRKNTQNVIDPDLMREAILKALTPALMKHIVPEGLAAIEEEHELAVALDNFTNPNHPDYDPVFDSQIRAGKSGWFDDEK
jgi:hypothetical protein